MSDLKVAWMLANQRSGTHMIRDAVNSHPDAYCPPEPFFHQCPKGDEIDQYLQRLSGERRVVLVDVKYHQARPDLYCHIKESGQRVLHLVRRDAEAQWFSIQRRRWLALHEAERHKYDSPRTAPRIPFDRAAFDRFVARRDQDIERAGRVETVRFYYEDLTGGGGEVDFLPEWASRALCRLMDLDYRGPLAVETRKSSPVNYGDYWIERRNR